MIPEPDTIQQAIMSYADDCIFYGLTNGNNIGQIRRVTFDEDGNIEEEILETYIGGETDET